MTQINNNNDAMRVLWQNFDVIDGARQAVNDAAKTNAVEDGATLRGMARDHADGHISEEDLIAVRDNPGFSDEQRAAAEYLLAHRDELEAVDGGTIDGDVGDIYRHDVTSFIDANRDALSYDVVAAADAATLLGIAPDFTIGRQDHSERLFAFANLMQGLSPADRALLLDEVTRQDPAAWETWLRLDGFNALGPEGTNAISPEAYDAVLGTLLESPQGVEQFIDANPGMHVDRYLEHTEGLNWRIANLGVAHSADEVQAAIAEFVGSQGEDWQQEYARLRQQVIDDGVRLLQGLGLEDLQGMSEADRQGLLDRILDQDNPQGQMAIAMALAEPGAVDAATLDAAMRFFASVDLADASPALAQMLGQARLQQAGQQLAQGDVDAGRAALESLRDSPYPELLGLDRTLFEATIDDLITTLAPGELSVEEAMAQFTEAADALDRVAGGGEPRPSEGLRVLAVGAAAIGLDANPDLQGNDLFGDPLTTIETLSGWADLGVDTVEMLTETWKLLPADGVFGRLSNPALGRALGAVGLVFGVPDLIGELNEGDWAQAGFAAAGVASASLALFAPAAWSAWAGPAGWALGAVAVFGTLALNQWRRVDASNEYMNDGGYSQQFLEHAGFAPDVADALTDQSGEGHSPVPFLFTYGASRGLDREQTIAWLNGLDADDLASIRDRAHEALDSVDGDLSKFEGTPDPDVMVYLQDYVAADAEGQGAYDDGNFFTVNGESRTIVAGSWEEFTALLEAKGLVTPDVPANGRAMDLPEATETVLQHFDDVSSDGDVITAGDLARVRDDSDADPEVRRAAEFLLLSRVSRHFLDVGAGDGGVDGKISRDDLTGALDTIRSGAYVDELLDTASGRGGRNGDISEDDIAVALVDPGLTSERRDAVAEMGDE